MQKSNKISTPQPAAYVTMQKINVYREVNFLFIYITDARFYRHANFVILLKRNASTHVCNCTPTGLVDLLSDGVDKLINDIKEHLVEIETIKHLLREENQHLKG